MRNRSTPAPRPCRQSWCSKQSRFSTAPRLMPCSSTRQPRRVSNLRMRLMILANTRRAALHCWAHTPSWKTQRTRATSPRRFARRAWQRSRPRSPHGTDARSRAWNSSAQASKISISWTSRRTRRRTCSRANSRPCGSCSTSGSAPPVARSRSSTARQRSGMPRSPPRRSCAQRSHHGALSADALFRLRSCVSPLKEVSTSDDCATSGHLQK